MTIPPRTSRGSRRVLGGPASVGAALFTLTVAGASPLWAAEPRSRQPEAKQAEAKQAEARRPEASAAFEMAPAPEGEVVVSERARERFEVGVQLLQDPDGARYEEAYEEFKAAYNDSPSWKILGNLALCAMKLERDGEAIAALEHSLAQGKGLLDPEEAAQQERDLKLLKDRVASLKLRAAPGTEVLDERVAVSGAKIRNRYAVPPSGELLLLLRPGDHRITAQFESGPVTFTTNLAPGGAFERTLAETAQSPSSKPAGPAPVARAEGANPYRVPAYVSLGVGAAGVVAGAVLLGLHLDTSGQANQGFSDCEASRRCDQSDVTRIQRLDDDAALQGTLSLVSFGVGAVGLGAGVALLMLKPAQEAPVGRGLQLRPFASGHQFGVSGQF